MNLAIGGVPEHFNLPWHLAREAGSIAIEWHDQPGGTGQMMAALADGSLDAVVALTEGVVAAVDAGLGAEIVQVYVSSPLQWGVHVGGGSAFTSVAELRGARVAISRFGSGSHLMAYVLAQVQGWTLTAEQFVPVGNLDGAVAALANGTADLFLWDRFMTQPLVDAGTFRRVGIQPTPWPCFVVACRTALDPELRASLDAVLDAVCPLAVALPARPGAAALIVERYGLAHETATEWLGVTTFAAREPVPADLVPAVRSLLAAATRT